MSPSLCLSLIFALFAVCHLSSWGAFSVSFSHLSFLLSVHWGKCGQLVCVTHISSVVTWNRVWWASFNPASNSPEEKIHLVWLELVHHPLSNKLKLVRGKFTGDQQSSRLSPGKAFCVQVSDWVDLQKHPSQFVYVNWLFLCFEVFLCYVNSRQHNYSFEIIAVLKVFSCSFFY